MLTLMWIPQLALKEKIWENFDPTRQTWVVGGAMTSSPFLRRRLLAKSEMTGGRPVKWASELWREILRHVDPSIRVIRTVGMHVLARDFLTRNETSDWCKRPRAPKKLLDACQGLASLITHARAFETLGEFQTEFKESGATFVELARLATLFYRECVERKKLPLIFLPYFLESQNGFPDFKEELIFDLGFDLSQGEKDLVQRLSRTNNIRVLVPAGGPDELDGKKLYSYKAFGLGVSDVTEVFVPAMAENENLEIIRCSSPDAESRKAVEIIKAWLSNGVTPQDICVAAPNISDYDSCITHDLRWEGVGVQREFKANLSASRLFRALNGRLEIVHGAINNNILTEAFLSVSSTNKSLQRHRESRVLKPVIEETQVPVDGIVRKIEILKNLRRKGPLTQLEFEKLLVVLFEDLIDSEIDDEFEGEKSQEIENRNSLFLFALQNLRNEFGGLEMTMPLWLEAWQEVTAEIPLIYKKASETGISLASLHSLQDSAAKYIIILGAVESFTPRTIVNSLGDKQILFILQLGFDFPFFAGLDSTLNWVLSGPWKKTILSCPKADQSGRAVVANPVWINQANLRKRPMDLLDFSTNTNWLHIQKNILDPTMMREIDRLKQWAPHTAEVLSQRVLAELLKTPVVSLPEMTQAQLPYSLSASTIETYWQCPFKFFARSSLGLSDEADLDLEPSPQMKGQWLHSAVESILKSERPLREWTDTALNELVENLDPIQKKLAGSLWNSIKSRFVRQLRRFVDFELDWQKNHPLTKPIQFEATLKGFLKWTEDLKSLFFSLDNVETELIRGSHFAAFKGKVDRIDSTSKGDALIIDYKSSDTQSSQIGSWNKKGSFQLALYIMAIEAGLLKTGRQNIIAAQYYSLKKIARDKGFYLADQDLSGILPLRSKNKAAIDAETKRNNLKEIEGSVWEVLEGIRKGVMTPLPRHEKNCSTCNWRTLCRAHHLL